MKTYVLIELLLAAMFVDGCMRERTAESAVQENIRLQLSTDGSRSSMIGDETLINDLNIWIYTSSGTLGETHYFDDLSMHASGNVDFLSSAGGHSRIVVIGNAGRELEAPQSESQSATYSMTYARDSAGAMLLAGDGRLALTSSGMTCQVLLHRAMSRIALRVELSSALVATGGVLGENVRIRQAVLCNSPAVFSLVPENAWSSVRTFKAANGTPMAEGDCFSASDIASLQSGETVFLYCLPNYTDLPYTDRPNTNTEHSTYIEMIVETDAFGTVSAGSFVCRFYASDGSRIGLEGGCSYTCMVELSNDTAAHSWRKDDYRFELAGAFWAGTRKTVNLLAGNHPAGAVSFSLSSTPGVLDDGTFELAGVNQASGYCTGVDIIAKGGGNGMLYAFDASGSLMGWVPLASVFPEIWVDAVSVDVTGSPRSYSIEGLDDVYAQRASDELFETLYGIVSVGSAETVDGISAGDFIYNDISSGSLYVCNLNWYSGGLERHWDETVGKSFGYRATLACGIYADFDVYVTNEEVGRFASTADYGEVVNTSNVPYPKSAVQDLDGRNITISRNVSAMPSSLLSGGIANGWASWYGGSVHEAGTPADAYISIRQNGVRWDFNADVTQSLYGEDIPVFIGKRNPWCGDYVRSCVGSYSSSMYVPVGLEYMLYQVSIDEYGYVYNDNGSIEVFTMLVFREHDAYSSIVEGSCKKGDNPGYMGGQTLQLGTTGTASWRENGRNCYMICYHGDYADIYDSGTLRERNISSSSSVASNVIWSEESQSSPKGRYMGAQYGGSGSGNIWLYLYCPYESQGVYMANASGRVSAKGIVPVHLWSVSEKATFEYQPQGDWVANGAFIPPWN